MQKIVNLKWKDISKEVGEPVVLAVELALHNVHAVHFQEPGQNAPYDISSWISHTSDISESAENYRLVVCTIGG